MSSPGAITIYSANKAAINLDDLVGATVKMALLSSAYTPDVSTDGDSVWADISTHEISAGNGYSAGGATLQNDAIAAITNGWKYTSDDVVWTAVSGNIPAWRYAVMYVSGTLWGLTNPLICYCLGDATPADVPATTADNTLTVYCPPDGWFDVT